MKRTPRLLKGLSRIIDATGNIVLNFFAGIGKFTLLVFQTFRWLFVPPFDKKEILNQMVHIGYNSLPVTLITSLFTGMVTAFQTGVTLEKTLKGTSQFMGSVVAISMTRELAPVLTAIILAGRIGSSIAAEIGTMKVTEQIDALKTLATNPVHYLVVPRFISLTIMLPVLTLIADFVGWVGGGVISVFALDIPFQTYYNNSQIALKMSDVWSGLIKSAFFGMIIAFIGCFKGFETEGGAEGVGKATTSAVVTSSILILIVDYFLGVFLNFLFNI